jgi:hypothetical protein
MTDSPRPGDVFAFPLQDTTFGAIMCTRIMGKRKPDYRFVAVVGNWPTAPSIADIAAARLPVVRIQSTMGRDKTASLQPGVDIFWDSDPSSPGFFIGLAEFTTTAADWLNIQPLVEKIGELVIRDAFNTMGALQYLQTFQGLQHIFSDIEDYVKSYGWQSYPVETLQSP